MMDLTSLFQYIIIKVSSLIESFYWDEDIFSEQIHVIIDQDRINDVTKRLADAVNRRMDDAAAELEETREDLDMKGGRLCLEERAGVLGSVETGGKGKATVPCWRLAAGVPCAHVGSSPEACLSH